ncbi:Sulfate-transporting ATPase [[Leptolyngbya] sp. PCC 7376]|uniref:ABC transporter ATP-binding protein n=1 Tax=[Leptolyngbya] sp. PCC 7376 TaxID=111781 RepID=UPI00029F19E4|nr:ABC transporter ATP-binding protein [[Leptolyngbya] sp. PCC 7376]AFY38068.1 Sulfate-transporting ATPase [[Leptolyngbya] sp. PCC 7376]
MIEVEQLNKRYGSTSAITDLSFRVDAGEIVGFLGPNGAGKTTTMRILAAYLPASSGTAKIAGHDVHENSMAVRQNIGYLPEKLPLYPEMTVSAFLDFVAQIKGISPGDRPEKISAAIETCNLEDQRNTVIRKLSRGFQQRVGIAQAIVHEPPVIILDEPTVGLDPAQLIEVRNLIKSLAGDRTVLLSTHLLSEVSMTCTRVVMINQGRLVATDTPDNLRQLVSGDGGYYLEIDGNPEEIKPLLAVLPGVQKIKTEILGDRRASLDITIAADHEPGRDIASIIVSAGMGLYEMRRTRSSLEDVFLELTRDESIPPETEPVAEKEETGDRPIAS